MPPAISRMVSESAAFLPTLSAYTPSTMPPTGRMKKPTPNVATASSSEVSSLPVGKNSFAMMTAKKLYTVKSNHSSPLPSTVAMMARRRCRASVSTESATLDESVPCMVSFLIWLPGQAEVSATRHAVIERRFRMHNADPRDT